MCVNAYAQLCLCGPRLCREFVGAVVLFSCSCGEQHREMDGWYELGARVSRASAGDDRRGWRRGSALQRRKWGWAWRAGTELHARDAHGCIPSTASRLRRPHTTRSVWNQLKEENFSSCASHTVRVCSDLAIGCGDLASERAEKCRCGSTGKSKMQQK